MSHFSKHVTGSTRLDTKSSVTTGTNSAFETSAYIKGDSLIVMAIDTTKNAHDLKLVLPVNVKSGIHLLSNEEGLLQESPITIDEPTSELTVALPARSLNTYIFMIDNESAAIKELTTTQQATPVAYYDLQGRRLDTPQGLCIEKLSDGTSRKKVMP
jgi:glucuronoarabinoxylan endo-1,4-beta-xylanase